jgi:hypothetical protein
VSDRPTNRGQANRPWTTPNEHGCSASGAADKDQRGSLAAGDDGDSWLEPNDTPEWISCDELSDSTLRQLDYLTPRLGLHGELVIPVDELGALGEPADWALSSTQGRSLHQSAHREAEGTLDGSGATCGEGTLPGPDMLNRSYRSGRPSSTPSRISSRLRSSASRRAGGRWKTTAKP